MPRPMTIDLDSADYQPARLALEWAFSNARRLGYTLPCGFDIAMALLKGEARTGLFISTEGGGFYSFVTQGDGDELDFDDYLAILTRQAERKKARRQEAKEAAKIIGELALALTSPAASGPICVDCGKPRAKGSASRCRACYEGKSEESPAELASA